MFSCKAVKPYRMKYEKSHKVEDLMWLRIRIYKMHVKL